MADSILPPVQKTPSSFWTDDVRSAPWVGGDALRSWTGASGAPWFGANTNWSPVGVPASGDDILFGTLMAGNYSPVQDMSIAFNTIAVNRSLATEQVNLSGIYTGNAFRVVKGTANVTTTTFAVSRVGATNAESSIVVGDGAGNVATLTLSGMPAKYYDARVGVNGSTGTLVISGVNTSLLPIERNISNSVFGGTADAANANIIVDAATVEAWVVTSGVRGSTRFINNAQVTSVPTPAGVGQVQIGSPDASNVSFEVSTNADLRISGQDGTVLIGSGVGAVTDTKVLSGGSIVSDHVITGATNAAGTASSNNTLTISGAGSVVTTTEALDTNGSYRFSDLRRGSTTINISEGGKLFTPRYDSNASDRASDTAPASSTTLIVNGLNSLLQARTDVGGLFISSLGDRTVDTITASNFGKIDARQLVLGVGVGASSTMNLASSARVTADLFEMARPSRAGAATTATLDVAGGAKVQTGTFTTSSSLTSLSNITVRGGASSIDVTGVGLLGGVAGDVLGGGSTNLTISSGASASFAALQAGGASATGKGSGYTGSQITVAGLGSQLVLRGSGTSTPQGSDLAANLILSAGASTTSSLTITNGGAVVIESNNPNPNLDGSIAMSTASNTSSSLLADGPDATLYAGKLITMAETPSANAFSNATATLTVRNGAFMAVHENPTDPASGNVQMAIRPGSNLSATMNIGGGTSTSDADTSVSIDGTLFVGGTGEAAPVPGGRATVNLNNGALSAAAVAVYANSSVTMNGGYLVTDNLLVPGGRINMSSTTPLTMELGAIRASNGGVINIGQGGAVVYYSSANGSPSDLDVIRQLIHNGSNGGAWNGTNSITSSLLSVASPRYAVGYADIEAAKITSLLNLSFTPGMEGVAVRYTLRGDSNLDGAVRFDDLLVLAQNYGKTGREWYQGDFNYTRLIDFDDVLLLAQNYGQSLLANGAVVTDAALASRFSADWALAQSLVPEPLSLSMLAVACTFLTRRQRFNRHT